MTKDTQVSAYITDETKQRLDMFVRETGLKKGRVIEDAIVAHLDALDELPDSAIIPTRITLSKQSFEEFVAELDSDSEPTEALRRLMRGR